jgi:2-C-methyl-D-erythritol 4-phosphate cytidylyltransferase
MPQFAVILPAAGSSTRFGADKLRHHLCGVPVLMRTCQAFLSRADVACLVLATKPADSQPSQIYDAELRDHPRVMACAGGSSRAQSVLNALRRVPDEVEWVAVHDAARPLVSQALIDRVFAAAIEHGAAIPALPVKLTIKEAHGPLPAKVQRTIPRRDLWEMQTPQVMRRADLLEAYERCPIPLDQVTDDAQLLELVGKEVWLVTGEEQNLKITTPLDLKIADMLLNENR